MTDKRDDIKAIERSLIRVREVMLTWMDEGRPTDGRQWSELKDILVAWREAELDATEAWCKFWTATDHADVNGLWDYPELRDLIIDALADSPTGGGECDDV